MAADIAPATNPASPTDDADDDLDIATLCPYCNTRPPIYTCPRCFARTCSVACSKKHKLFRQCNGIRDPTAYVKRSKLMTEGGVNRDFAFLTGLEKQISRPSKTCWRPFALASERSGCCSGSPAIKHWSCRAA